MSELLYTNNPEENFYIKCSILEASIDEPFVPTPGGFTDRESIVHWRSTSTPLSCFTRPYQQSITSVFCEYMNPAQAKEHAEQEKIWRKKKCFSCLASSICTRNTEIERDELDYYVETIVDLNTDEPVIGLGWNSGLITSEDTEEFKYVKDHKADTWRENPNYRGNKDIDGYTE